MLLVAMPKSASTSLMTTFASLHKIKAKQDTSMRSNSKPARVKWLANWHSDMKELDAAHIEKMCREGVIFKQHVYPSKHNLSLLKGKRIVLLVRDPQEVLDAYYKGR